MALIFPRMLNVIIMCVAVLSIFRGIVKVLSLLNVSRIECKLMQTPTLHLDRHEHSKCVVGLCTARQTVYDTKHEF